ncbi:hypothetical protein [Gordonia neofelifaecis]|uniref:Transmembrane protein n=1 Tax=Gordonia neofelifaecis NRRL B-59395 TaxID=644548 RepID=F1YIL3_9ACTN|nr:hypothetical protein [Gordonia neofelifaecis]EGD55321.1 hypothetical protein SCNU_08686 [Gordonia neofelifaecis NRRL B-59395]
MARQAKTIPAILLRDADESWGDERERSVMLEAYAYVFILATILLWTLAAVAAWFVPAWVTVALFVALLVPSMEWQRYCKARGVDANVLAYGSAAWWRTALIGCYFGACAISMATAVIAGLGSDDSVAGGVVGGIAGAIAAVFVGRWAAKRKLKRAD